MKKIFLVALLICLVAASVSLYRRDHNAQTIKQTSPTKNTGNNSPDQPMKATYSTDQAASLWAVVNKGRALPKSYIPSNLVVPDIPLAGSAAAENMHVRDDMAAALKNLVNAASAEGVKLMLVSGYRSYATQVSVYNGYVSSSSQQSADTYSARPGHSEHQTGLAADLGVANGVCQLDQCFGDTTEGKWLAANAYKYGFIIRYQKNTQNLTGYEYEPWHVRYVGSDLASQIQASGQTLEQYFGLPAYTDYPANSFGLHSD
jgi:D-alanyl-D-alanine carboxypeptidase